MSEGRSAYQGEGDEHQWAGKPKTAGHTFAGFWQRAGAWAVDVIMCASAIATVALLTQTIIKVADMNSARGHGAQYGAGQNYASVIGAVVILAGSPPEKVGD
jgi:hypothetical protein